MLCIHTPLRLSFDLIFHLPPVSVYLVHPQSHLKSMTLTFKSLLLYKCNTVSNCPSPIVYMIMLQYEYARKYGDAPARQLVKCWTLFPYFLVVFSSPCSRPRFNFRFRHHCSLPLIHRTLTFRLFLSNLLLVDGFTCDYRFLPFKGRGDTSGLQFQIFIIIDIIISSHLPLYFLFLQPTPCRAFFWPIFRSQIYHLILPLSSFSTGRPRFWLWIFILNIKLLVPFTALESRVLTPCLGPRVQTSSLFLGGQPLCLELYPCFGYWPNFCLIGWIISSSSCPLLCYRNPS